MVYTAMVIMYNYFNAHRMPVIYKSTVTLPTKATNQLTY